MSYINSQHLYIETAANIKHTYEAQMEEERLNFHTSPPNYEKFYKRRLLDK